MKYLGFREFGLAGAAALGIAAPAQAVPVDLELSLLIDVSGSVDATEYQLQRDGYKDAFNSTAVWDAIDAGDLGKIAVNLVFWSTTSVQALGWTLIDSEAASDAFGDAIGALARPGGIGTYTGITQALEFATPLFTNGYEGTRSVIDVSGDGRENVFGGSLGSETAAKDAALLAASSAACAGGIDSINGIAIQSATLETYYDDFLVCGAKGFSLFASNFSTFGSAIDDKLIAEITDTPPSVVPLPVPAVLLLSGLGGLFAVGRRRS